MTEIACEGDAAPVSRSFQGSASACLSRPGAVNSAAGASASAVPLTDAEREAAKRRKIAAGVRATIERKRAEAKSRSVERQCLKCRQPFYSEGIGNRVCVGCKSQSDWW